MRDHCQPTVARLTRTVQGFGAALLLALCAQAHADLTIQITQGVTAPIPIAVVPFAQGPGPQPVDPAGSTLRPARRAGRAFAPQSLADRACSGLHGHRCRIRRRPCPSPCTSLR